MASCGSGSSFLSECGSGSGSSFPNPGITFKTIFKKVKLNVNLKLKNKVTFIHFHATSFHTVLFTPNWLRYFLPFRSFLSGSETQELSIWYFYLLIRWAGCHWISQPSCLQLTLQTLQQKYLHYFKGIVSWDFDGIFMILSFSLDVRQLPLDILFLKFYVIIFKFYLFA
jgi:hypothetical protein